MICPALLDKLSAFCFFSSSRFNQWLESLDPGNRLQPLSLWPELARHLDSFVYYYPLFMAYLWMFGALIFYFRHEWRHRTKADQLPKLTSYPPVSVLIPCYNEGENIRETIEILKQQKYPNFEIIAINDGSRDNTLEILQQLAEQYGNLRIVNLQTNQGKAMGLRTAALLANSEYLVCIDADALLAPEAIAWLVKSFLNNPGVGAITGNPRIRNRSSLLGRIQVGEFSAIVGMIKRAQRTYGRVFTISGVIAAFRRSALHDVGYWSNDMVTEDIDISWKLQLAGWSILFEPNALCWVLMPESLKGLWNQRVRWAQGGTEVLLRYFRALFRWSSRSMWPLYAECLISVCWSFLIVSALICWLFDIINNATSEPLTLLSPSWTTMLLSLTCLLQFGVSLAIDARYEYLSGGTARYYYWMVWYPVVYWLINVATTITGSVKAIRKKRGQRAIWITLDRGLREK